MTRAAARDRTNDRDLYRLIRECTELNDAEHVLLEYFLSIDTYGIYLSNGMIAQDRRWTVAKVKDVIGRLAYKSLIAVNGQTNRRVISINWDKIRLHQQPSKYAQLGDHSSQVDGQTRRPKSPNLATFPPQLGECSSHKAGIAVKAVIPPTPHALRGGSA